MTNQTFSNNESVQFTTEQEKLFNEIQEYQKANQLNLEQTKVYLSQKVTEENLQKLMLKRLFEDTTSEINLELPINNLDSFSSKLEEKIENLKTLWISESQIQRLINIVKWKKFYEVKEDQILFKNLSELNQILSLSDDKIKEKSDSIKLNFKNIDDVFVRFFKDYLWNETGDDKWQTVELKYDNNLEYKYRSTDLIDIRNKNMEKIYSNVKYSWIWSDCWIEKAKQLVSIVNSLSRSAKYQPVSYYSTSDLWKVIKFTEKISKKIWFEIPTVDETTEFFNSSKELVKSDSFKNLSTRLWIEYEAVNYFKKEWKIATQKVEEVKPSTTEKTQETTPNKDAKIELASEWKWSLA